MGQSSSANQHRQRDDRQCGRKDHFNWDQCVSIGTNALETRTFCYSAVRCKTMRHQPVKQMKQVRCRRRTGTTMDLAERPKVTGALVGVDGFKDAGPADSVRRIFTITNMFRRERAKSINPKISASHQMSPSCRDWTRVVIFGTRCCRQNCHLWNWKCSTQQSLIEIGVRRQLIQLNRTG